MTLTIQNDIPIPKNLPEQRRPIGDKVSQTIAKLKVGDSFVMENFKDKAIASRLRSASANYHRRFTYRRIENTDNARVWRVS